LASPKGKMQGNNYQIDKEPLLELPIYKPHDTDGQRIVYLVNDILKAKKQGLETSYLEQQIDILVYQLYELTPDEIAIVENSGKAAKQLAETTE